MSLRTENYIYCDRLRGSDINKCHIKHLIIVGTVDGIDMEVCLEESGWERIRIGGKWVDLCPACSDLHQKNILKKSGWQEMPYSPVWKSVR